MQDTIDLNGFTNLLPAWGLPNPHIDVNVGKRDNQPALTKTNRGGEIRARKPLVCLPKNMYHKTPLIFQGYTAELYSS